MYVCVLESVGQGSNSPVIMPWAFSDHSGEGTYRPIHHQSVPYPKDSRAWLYDWATNAFTSTVFNVSLLVISAKKILCLPLLFFNWCLVAKSCPTLCDPMDYTILGFSVLHYLPEFAQAGVCWVSDAIQPSHPLPLLLLLPSIFPRITVFSKEWAVRIRWPK